MAFTLRRRTTLSPAAAFDALLDVEAHTADVPLTVTRVDAGAPRVGWGFTARTGVGPVGFDDRMVLTAYDAGRSYRVVKVGSVLQGWAQVDVRPVEGGCEVTWSEELHLPGLLAPLTRRVGDVLGSRLFARVLDGVLGRAALEATR